MMNNENKPTASWPEKLFHNPKVKKTEGYHKTYFAHVYSNDQTTSNLNEVCSLFFNANTPSTKESASSNLAILNENLSSKTAGPNTNSASFIANISDKNSTNQYIVLNCYEETPNTKTFRLINVSGLPFAYLPGQYVTLSVLIEGQEHKRSYSLASTPSRSGLIEITIKRDPNGGVVSNWVNNHLKIGDIVKIKGPFGNFTCAKEIPKKILFLAAGSGVVPIMSMLRWLTDTEKQVDVVVLLSFRDSHNIIYRDELNLIAAHHDNIKLAIALTQNPVTVSRWNELKGRINKNTLQAITPDIYERTVYLCGPDVFMADCKRYLHDLKLPCSHLFYESFSLSSTNAALHQPNTPLSHSSFRPGDKAKNYQIHFARSGINVDTDGMVSLLTLAEQSGIRIAHECRSGHCGECIIKCLEGKVVMTDQAEVDDIDRKKGWVYACCAYPASNISLDI